MKPQPHATAASASAVSEHHLTFPRTSRRLQAGVCPCQGAQASWNSASVRLYILPLTGYQGICPPPDSKDKITWWCEVPQRSSIQRRRAWKHWASPSNVHTRGWAMPGPWCLSLQVQGRAQLCGHLLDMDVGKPGGWRQGGAGMPELLRGAPLFHTRTFASCIQICKYLYFLSCSNRHLLGDPCSIFHLLHALAEALGYLLWLRLV